MSIWGHYSTWLLLFAGLFFLAERVVPQRRQRLDRQGILRDLFFLAFNGHAFGFLVAWRFSAWFSDTLKGSWLDIAAGGLVDRPAWIQFVAALLLLDFCKWLTHVLLHTVPVLWHFHRVHHSLVIMDWIGNWRFHWFEILFYTVTTTPAVLFLTSQGVSSEVLLVYYVVETFIGNLNHANIKIDFGPLKYVLNSPRMHLWHHAWREDGRINRNFGIALSLWDWIFRTVHWPSGVPKRLGFEGLEELPVPLWRQLILPFGAVGARKRDDHERE